MSIKRVTISVPEELADRIKKAAGEQPVSTWVNELIQHHLGQEDADRLWKEYVAEVKPGWEHYDWADRVLASGERAGKESDAA